MSEYMNTSEFTTTQEIWTINGKKCNVTVHSNSISDNAIKELAEEILRVEAMRR
jgi:hypothetical protein